MDRMLPFSSLQRLYSDSCEFVSIHGPDGLFLRPVENLYPGECKTIGATNGHEFTRIRKFDGSPQTTPTGTVQPLRVSLVEPVAYLCDS